MNDALGAAVAGQPTTYGPLILSILIPFALLVVALNAWMVRGIYQLGRDDITNSKKAHDEIMENKLAGAVLNETTKDHERRITALESYHDATLQPKGTAT